MPGALDHAQAVKLRHPRAGREGRHAEGCRHLVGGGQVPAAKEGLHPLAQGCGLAGALAIASAAPFDVVPSV